MWQQVVDSRAGRVRRDTEFCPWLGENCNGPMERFVSRVINLFLFGVTDCNGMCRARGGSGGRCVQGNAEINYWCQRGYRCACHWMSTTTSVGNFAEGLSFLDTPCYVQPENARIRTTTSLRKRSATSYFAPLNALCDRSMRSVKNTLKASTIKTPLVFIKDSHFCQQLWYLLSTTPHCT